MLKDVSAEEDHFSDATEGIGDEEAPATPVSTPLRFRLEAELEDDTPTPVNMSPRAPKFPRIMEVPIDVAGSGTEPITLDTRRLLQEQETYREPIIPSPRSCTNQPVVETPAKQDYGIGAEFIEVPEKQEHEQQDVGTGDVTEQTLTIDNVFGNDFVETTPDDFPDRGTEEKDVGVACEFGDEFDDFGETVEGGDGFVDFEGFEEGTTGGEFGTLDFAEVSQPAPAPPQSQHVMPLLPIVRTP